MGALGRVPLARAQGNAIRLIRRPVEVARTAVTPRTVRISIAPIENGSPMSIPADGSLVDRTWPPPVARLRTIAAPQTIRAGDFAIRVAGGPLSISITAGGRRVQQIEIDGDSGAMTFLA